MASNKLTNAGWYDFIFKSKEVAKQWIPILEAQHAKVNPGNYEQSISRLPLMDYDRTFALEPEPEIIPAGFENSEGNEISLDDIKKRMFQMSNGDLNFVASCKCGHLRGNYNLNSTCPQCGTECRTAFANEVNFGGWLVVPDTLPPLLHPVAYRILKRWMGRVYKQNVHVLDALLDPSQTLPEPFAGTVGQGMAYFCQNFDDIIAFVANLHRGQKSKDNEYILEFIKEYRDCMFVRHIPILNQSLHVMTQAGTMTYNDESCEFIFQTWLELSNTIITQRHRPDMKPEYLAERVWSIYSSWMQYVDSIIDPKLSGKTGFIRKCLLGDRMHASARAVIVPITANRWADEIELPWRMVVGLYKLEIMNILTNRYGCDINEACKLFNNALVTYDAKVDSCLQTLHEECPFKGFPILMGRNPTLQHGAIQIFFCKHYKTDPRDNTVGMIPYSISRPNADFDGDSLYLLSVKEMCTVLDCMKIHPLATMLGGEGGSLSPSVKMSSEMAVSASGWLVDGVTKSIADYKKAAGM